MGDGASRVALVTGASSGIGLETAARLMTPDMDRVFVACRTRARAEVACRELQQRTGVDRFEPLAADLADPAVIGGSRPELRRVAAEYYLFIDLNLPKTSIFENPARSRI